MASTACALPASKSIAELVGAQAYTMPIKQAPGPHGTGFRPRDTGLETWRRRANERVTQLLQACHHARDHLERLGCGHGACQSPIEMSPLLPVRDVTTRLSNACFCFV